jgi:hypothetical protein
MLFVTPPLFPFTHHCHDFDVAGKALLSFENLLFGQVGAEAENKGYFQRVVPRWFPHTPKACCLRLGAPRGANGPCAAGITVLRSFNRQNHVEFNTTSTDGADVIQHRYVEFKTNDRDGADTIRYDFDRSRGRSLPFEFVIKLASPLRRGIDYGFLPGTNVSKKGESTSNGL